MYVSTDRTNKTLDQGDGVVKCLYICFMGVRRGVTRGAEVSREDEECKR